MTGVQTCALPISRGSGRRRPGDDEAEDEESGDDFEDRGERDSPRRGGGGRFRQVHFLSGRVGKTTRRRVEPRSASPPDASVGHDDARLWRAPRDRAIVVLQVLAVAAGRQFGRASCRERV